MSFNVGKAVGYLELDTSAFKRGFKSALEDLRVFKDDTAKITDKLDGLGSAFTSVGSSLSKKVTIPIVGVGTAIVKTAADFESSMSQVKAITDASDKDFETLRQTAIDLGASTKFSSKEVADGMTEMAKAGWDSQQIIEGMSGVLDAAAASGEDLSSVSTIVADAITAFGMKASESTTVADLLTEAANDGTIGINDLGESLKYIAPVASTMGFSIKDVVTALSAMSKSGIKGSQAGTSLRTMMLRLADPTDKVAAAMEELGIDIADEHGNMYSLDKILEDMRGSFSGLTEEQKSYYASVLAGKETSSGLLSLMNMTQDEYDELSKTMKNSSGVADETARVMQDNLSNKIEQLGGACESLAITLGDLIIPALEDVVEKATKVVEWFTQLDTGTQQIIITIAAVAAAIGPVLTIIGNVIKMVSLMKKGIGLLNAVLIANPIVAVIATIAMLIAILVQVYNTNEDFRKSVNEVCTTVINAVSAFVSGLIEYFTVTVPNAISTVVSWFQSLGTDVGNLFTVIIPNAIIFLVNKIVELVSSIISTGAQVLTNISNVISSIVSFFASLPGKLQTHLTKAINNFVTWVSNLANKAKDVGTKVINKIVTFFSNLPGKLKIQLTNAFNNFKTWITNLTNKAKDVGTKVVDKIVTFFSNLPGKIADHLSKALGKLKDWGDDMASAASKKISTVSKNIVNGFNGLPKKITDIGKNLVQGLINGIQSKVEAVKKKVSSITSIVTKGFKKGFDEHSPSKITYEDGANLMYGLGNGISDKLSYVTSSVTEGVKEILAKILELIQSAENRADLLAFISTLSDTIVNSLNNQKTAYDQATESVQTYIAALKSLQTVQAMLATAKNLSFSNTLLENLNSDNSSSNSRTKLVDTTNKTKGSSGDGNTYIFNSPTAVNPVQAAKLLRQTSKQLAMGTN